MLFGVNLFGCIWPITNYILKNGRKKIAPNVYLDAYILTVSIYRRNLKV